MHSQQPTYCEVQLPVVASVISTKATIEHQRGHVPCEVLVAQNPQSGPRLAFMKIFRTPTYFPSMSSKCLMS